MKTFKEQFANNLKTVRIQRGLTCRELARLARVSNNTLRAWEEGGGNVRFDLLPILARILCVPVKRFFEFDEEEGGCWREE